MSPGEDVSHAAARFLGIRMPELIAAYCEGALRAAPPDAHATATRKLLALTLARAAGLLEAQGDPFTHVPPGVRILERIVERVEARAAVSAADWHACCVEGVAAGENGACFPVESMVSGVLRLTSLLGSVSDELDQAMRVFAIPPAIAKAAASATLAAGLGYSVGGEYELWARRLAYSNRSCLRGLPPEKMAGARASQAGAFQRFANSPFIAGQSRLSACQATHVPAFASVMGPDPDGLHEIVR